MNRLAAKGRVFALLRIYRKLHWDVHCAKDIVLSHWFPPFYTGKRKTHEDPWGVICHNKRQRLIEGRDKEAWRHTLLVTTMKLTSTWMMTTTTTTTSTSTSYASTLPIPCSLWWSAHPVVACGQRWSVVPHKDRPRRLGAHAKVAERCLYVHKDVKMIYIY